MSYRYIIIGVIFAVFMAMAALAFDSAKMTANSPPEFVSIATQTVMEGNNFNLTIRATDPDEDPITIIALTRPAGSIFTDNGDGTASLEWIPDHTGPNSSEGSPFLLSFLASDGSASDQIQVYLNVLNNNRKPAINPVGTVEYEAGELVTINISGSDADSDPLTWNLLEGPSEITFTADIDAQISWQTEYADSGSYDIEVELEDSYGASDTVDINLIIMPKAIYALYIDGVGCYPGENATIRVNLMNLEEISGFNLLISYDVSALLLSYLTTVGTRAESFEYFTYTRDKNGIRGDVQIVGMADVDNGTVTDNLPAGDGSLVNLTFYVTNDISFSGYSIPVRFAFRNLLDNLDNTLTDADGGLIEQSAIGHTDGYIDIEYINYSGLGDINLNGVAYEIADAIYFINYFINPGKYPLSAKQKANTDINKDGLTATVADLVFLMNYLVNPGGASGKLRPELYPVEVTTRTTADNFSISYDSDVEIGGLVLTLEAEDMFDERFSSDLIADAEGMTVKSGVDGNLLRLLIYSDNGRTMASGVNEFLHSHNDNRLTVKDIQFSSADGSLMKTVIDNSFVSSLPAEFYLEQNYPNPFNPATDIGFSLSHMAEVKLTVYNLLGREVKTLMDASLPAGHYHVVWDGRDDFGSIVSSGIYFYRLKADDFTAQRKMILLK